MNNYKEKFEVVVFVLYKCIFPLVTVLFMIIIPFVIQRPRLWDSVFADFIVRTLICLAFCFNLVRAPEISNYKFIPGKVVKKTDISTGGKVFYISMGCLSGIAFSFVTYNFLKIFLPILGDFGIWIAVINGVIHSLPLIAHYEVLKL